MNVLTFLIRLPLLSIRGVVSLANLIQEQAERQMVNPAKVRGELEHAERARAAGEISDEQMAEIQRAAFAEFAKARRRLALGSGIKG